MAQGVFSDALPTARAYAALLAGDGVLRGLIGPREVSRLWERHLVNCALLSDGIAPGARVADIGSGAGLPGLVLAIRRPDLELTLVEPLLRRSTFLVEAAERLELGNVSVVRARAEELHGAREFDVVTSRAVAPLPRLLDWSMPLVRRGGALLAMKGASVHEEIAAARSALDARGTTASVEVYGEGLVSPPTTAVRVVAAQPSGLGWEARRPRRGSRPPRRAGRKGHEA